MGIKMSLLTFNYVYLFKARSANAAILLEHVIECGIAKLENFLYYIAPCSLAVDCD